MLCQPCLFHTFLFSLHSIPFDDPLQLFRESCSYLIIFIKHNILFYLIMTFSVFPNLRCPGVTKHGQNFESADQDWPDVPGFLSFSHTVHAHETLPKDKCDYFGTNDSQVPQSDVCYIGFWTDKGNADQKTLELLSKLKNKKIF